MRTSTFAVALASVLLLAGAGVGGAFAATAPLQPQQSTTDNGTAAGSSTPSVTFNDQNSSGGSILIQSATLPEKGFVVINGTRGGTDRVVGSSYLLNAGTSSNIRVQLDHPLNGSQSLTAVLYADTNGNGKFDSGSAGGQNDKPVYIGNSDRRVVDIARVSASSGNAGSATQTTASGATTTNATTTGSNTTQTNATTTGSNTTQTNATTQPAGGAGNATTAGNANESGGSNGSSSGGSNDSGSGGSGGSGAFGPGFGPVVAVVALLAVALFVRRH